MAYHSSNASGFNRLSFIEIYFFIWVLVNREDTLSHLVGGKMRSNHALVSEMRVGRTKCKPASLKGRFLNGSPA